MHTRTLHADVLAAHMQDRHAFSDTGAGCWGGAVIDSLRCASFPCHCQAAQPRRVGEWGGTAARKHARDPVDDAGLIGDKHRDDMLLDALLQRLRAVDVDIVDFFRAPKLHAPWLPLKVHVHTQQALG